MPSAGFETTISAGERPQTHALDRAVTGTGCSIQFTVINSHCSNVNSDQYQEEICENYKLYMDNFSFVVY